MTSESGMSNATKAEGDSSNKITSSTAENKGTVLLQTASCVAFNGSKSVPVRQSEVVRDKQFERKIKFETCQQGKSAFKHVWR